MSRRLLRRGCSYPTRNPSSKARCQHDRICRKSLGLLSMHLFLAGIQLGGENDPTETCREGCLRRAGPCGAFLCTTLRVQQEICSKRKSIPFPRTAPRLEALWVFPPTGPRLGKVCLLRDSFQNHGGNKSLSIGLVMLFSSATGW